MDTYIIFSLSVIAFGGAIAGAYIVTKIHSKIQKIDDKNG